MDDYALVFNAGSSSLKFCVYRRPAEEAWRLEARGQIDGIGTSPRLTAKDDAGGSVADEKLDASVRDGRAALGVLAGWLRARYGGSRVLGVGHRVVHGGAKYAGPCIVTPAVLDDLRALVPLAPLHQPHNIAAIEAVQRAAARRAAGGVLRYELPPRPAGRGGTGAAAEGDSRRPASSATASTGSRTSTSRRRCPRWRRTSPTAA